MNRSRWISLGFVGLFIVVTIVVPKWKEHAGLTAFRSVDGVYAAFIILCMGLACIWWGDELAPAQPADESENEPQPRGRRQWTVKSVGWLFLGLSIVIAAADLIR